jgi:hypothetical protein
MKSIQAKLQKNDATITRTDKGNSTVILPKSNTIINYKSLYKTTSLILPTQSPQKLFSYKEHNKQQQSSHPKRNKMEINKPESVSTQHKRPHNGA